MTGKCRYCKAAVNLIDGKWQHDGIGALVHIIKQMHERPDTKSDFALAGPSKGGS